MSESDESDNGSTLADDGGMTKRRRPMLVVRSMEGRRANADHPIAPEDYKRQLRKLQEAGLRIPRSATPADGAS